MVKNRMTRRRGEKAILGDDPLWFKDAIIYELHVRAFSDSDSDGIGDFRGLTHKLDYLQDLGITTLWLLPFCPSPLRDDGYDIADYTGIHPDYGTLRDFRIFLRISSPPVTSPRSFLKAEVEQITGIFLPSILIISYSRLRTSSPWLIIFLMISAESGPVILNTSSQYMPTASSA